MNLFWDEDNEPTKVSREWFIQKQTRMKRAEKIQYPSINLESLKNNVYWWCDDNLVTQS